MKGIEKMRQLRVYQPKLLQGLLVAIMLLGSLTQTSLAETTYRKVYDPQTRQYYYVPENSLRSQTRSALKNPVVKQAAIGAAVGAASGLLSDRTSVVKGAGIGALVGAGTGYMDKSQALQDKPLARTALKGAAIGTGAGLISGHGFVKGALIGAAGGAGVHYFKNYLNQGDYRNTRYDRVDY
jgi:hypothetical protein